MTTDTAQLALRLRTHLGQLETQLDERDRLVNVLRLEPSASDNDDVVGLMARALECLQRLQDVASDSSQLARLAAQYDRLVLLLAGDAAIDVAAYRFTPREAPKAGKSVRFAAHEPDRRSELMGTRTFRPYTDADESLDNKQLFAQHQQQLLQQDRDLDVLHGSVRTQKSMGLSINDEIDSHLILLSDLERGVDSAHVKVQRTTTRLGDFRARVQENGSLATIVVLTVILVLLLVVLN